VFKSVQPGQSKRYRVHNEVRALCWSGHLPKPCHPIHIDPILAPGKHVRRVSTFDRSLIQSCLPSHCSAQRCLNFRQRPCVSDWRRKYAHKLNPPNVCTDLKGWKIWFQLVTWIPFLQLFHSNQASRSLHETARERWCRNPCTGVATLKRIGNRSSPFPSLRRVARE